MCRKAAVSETYATMRTLGTRQWPKTPRIRKNAGRLLLTRDCEEIRIKSHRPQEGVAGMRIYFRVGIPRTSLQRMFLETNCPPCKLGVEMDVPSKGNHSRNQFRCPHNGTPDEATLLINGRQTPVRLIDESAGGFGVLADQCPPCQLGDEIRLNFDSAQFVVRVVYVCEVPRGNSVTGGPAFRLGLERLADLAEFREGVWWRRLLRAACGKRARSQMATAVMLLILAAGIGVIPLSRKSAVQNGASENMNLASPSGPDQANTPEDLAVARNSSGAQGAPSKSAWARIVRLPGASVFLPRANDSGTRLERFAATNKSNGWWIKPPRRSDNSTRSFTIAGRCNQRARKPCWTNRGGWPSTYSRPSNVSDSVLC